MEELFLSILIGLLVKKKTKNKVLRVFITVPSELLRLWNIFLCVERVIWWNP